MVEKSWDFHTVYLKYLHVVFFFDYLDEGMSDKKARKETIKKSPFSKDTVYKVLKEKHMYGYFLDGPLPRTRLSIYDKLSVEKKEQIRFTVSFETKMKNDYIYIHLYLIQCLKSNHS